MLAVHLYKLPALSHGWAWGFLSKLCSFCPTLFSTLALILAKSCCQPWYDSYCHIQTAPACPTRHLTCFYSTIMKIVPYLEQNKRTGFSDGSVGKESGFPQRANIVTWNPLGRADLPWEGKSPRSLPGNHGTGGAWRLWSKESLKSQTGWLSQPSTSEKWSKRTN